ncbi:MAG: 4Fe-4S dicluster domain-containing protein [Planctomycetes bacterium]|nr:4Fe-4S dicluster domain-containing protein [Planctomycetota bacterium]
MPAVIFDRDRCKGCELCLLACPQQALGMARDLNARGYFHAVLARPWKCIACGLCAVACPDVAIEVESRGVRYVLFEA